MPKVYLTEKQKDYSRLKDNLKLIQGKRTCEQMGVIIGGSKATFSRRLKRPESLTYEEMKRLCDFFKIDLSVFCAGTLKIQ